jgi:clan AA aspartic protease (TIGR02281 family)
MGSSNHFFIFFAVVIIGAVAGSQVIFSRIPFEQIFHKARLDRPLSGQVTAGSEDSVIPLEQLGGVWVARVELNDLHHARLIVDTGATFTTISEDLAFHAGVQTDTAQPYVSLLTAGGKVRAGIGFARRIRVGNAGRDDVQVVVHTIPHLPDGVDGLLGLSFFDRFLVRLDHRNQQLHLSPKT